MVGCLIDENYSQPILTLFLGHFIDAKQLLFCELSENMNTLSIIDKNIFFC